MTMPTDAAVPRRYRDSIPIAVWEEWTSLFGIAIGVELLGQLLPAGPLRAVVTIPPILLVPGFCLLSLVLGQSRPKDPAALGLFSFVTSLSVLMLDALLLNLFRIRLTTESLGVTLLFATGALMAASVALGRRMPPAFTKESGALTTPSRTATRLIAAVISTGLVVTTVWFVATRMPAPVAKPFASLSLGPSWATLDAPPTIRSGTSVAIPVVITTDKEPAGQHELTTTVDGTVMSERQLDLGSKSTWRGQVSVVAPSGPSLHKVTITLTGPGTSSNAQTLILYLHTLPAATR